jgi:outer membrane protein assembly factor BamB
MSEIIFVGIRGTVLALESGGGTEIWRTEIASGDFVNLAQDSSCLYATAQGEIFCLDKNSGQILWHNKLKGLGTGLLSVLPNGVGGAAASMMAEEVNRRAQEAAGASAATS